MKKIRSALAMLVVMIWASPQCFCAATYYVDRARADDSGNGQTWSTAKKYIGSGIGVMSGGDTLIIRDGTYTDTRDIIKNVPSGSAGSYTTIKAEHDFGVILQGFTIGTAPSNNEAVINLYQKSYVTVEGLIIKDSQGTDQYALSAVEVWQSNHCRLRKIGVKNGTPSAARYGGAVDVYQSSYCLLEDVFACGMMRYGVHVGGGSDGAANNHNILRRVVVRWDYCTTSEPRAAIAVYGGFAGTTPSDHILLQNCMVIDGNQGDNSGGTFTGGFSSPHETAYVERYGCISLNNRGYGFHSSEDSLCHDNTNTQCVVWDCDNGMYWKHLASGVSGAYNCTAKDVGLTGPSDAGRGTTYDCVASNNVFINASATNMTLSGNTSSTAAAFTYIVQSPVTGKGATIEKKMGATGTLYNETGYNTLTGESLWPWPYEDKIKELFSETNNPPSGLSPATNNTTRGFCATNMTLTKYIWEYLGNTMPAQFSAAISGNVKDADGNNMNGATVMLSGGASQTLTTAADGSYQFSGIAINGNYTVTPAKPGYVFGPVSRSTESLTANISGWDFIGAVSTTTYSINGIITNANGVRLGGILVTLSGYKSDEVLTASDGSYQLNGLLVNANYAISPSNRAYLFSPATRSTAAISADIVNWNFSASADTGIVGTSVNNEIRVVGSTERQGIVNPDEGDSAKIYFKGAETGKYECRIFMLTGEQVWQSSQENINEGMFEWFPKGMASGGYIVHVKGPGYNSKKKMAVVR